MKKSILTILIICFFTNIYGQEKTKVLLLATYHFGNTSDKMKVSEDILSPKKQKQINELLEKLNAFKPEKIYVENQPNRQNFWDSIYKNYQKAHKPLKIRNEIFQIGIKLAEKSNIKEGVTCVDWQIEPTHTFTEKEYMKYLHKILKYDDSIEKINPSQESKYEKEISSEIKNIYGEIPKMDLIDGYKIINSKKFIDKMFYGNISSLLDIDVNKTNVFWSQNNMIRNVNVYQNIIQNIIRNKPKRVIVIYGAGHIKALRNYLEVHPAIEIVNTIEYLE